VLLRREHILTLSQIILLYVKLVEVKRNTYTHNQRKLLVSRNDVRNNLSSPSLIEHATLPILSDEQQQQGGEKFFDMHSLMGEENKERE
jgi:hypothetical protein